MVIAEAAFPITMPQSHAVSELRLTPGDRPAVASGWYSAVVARHMPSAGGGQIMFDVVPSVSSIAAT